MNGIRKLHLYLTAASLCLAIVARSPLDGIARAAGGEENAAPENVAKPYTAVVEIQSTGPTVYLDPVFVSIRITPLRAIDVDQIVVQPLGLLKTIYPHEGDGWPCRVGDNAGLPGRPFVVTCEVGDPRSLPHLLANPAVFFAPSRQKLVIEVRLRENANEVNFYEEVFVEFGAPKIGVVYGGFFGALLLAVFTALRSQIEASRPGPGSLSARVMSGAGHVVRAIWRIIAMSIVGGICALVLILLAQVSEGMSPPISIRVQDFWGGVVVGLFSVPLSRWMADRFGSGARERP